MTVFNVLGIDALFIGYFFVFVLGIVTIICLPILIISIYTIVKYRKQKRKDIE